jgi:DNA-binding beta-propeller fold protein YncE
VAVSAGGGGRLRGLGAVGAALVLIGFLLGAAGARADRIYWLNWGDGTELATIGAADTDGRGGGPVELAGARIFHPEGMAYDPVANRLYIASERPGETEGQISWVGLEGGGSGVFTAPGAVFRRPAGVAIDPAARTIYWVNTAIGSESIGWARLDGAIGGALNTSGARVSNPYRLALDPVGGRVYWSEFDGGAYSFQYADADDTGGGGELALATPPREVTGMAVDTKDGRLYWLQKNPPSDSLFDAGLGGGAVGSMPLGAADRGGQGLAVDPALGRAYWGNFGSARSPVDALGYAVLGGPSGGITPLGGPVDGPQDPIVIKAPASATAPVLSRAKAQLSCSQGTWAPDFPGSFVYQAPRAIAYQWTLDGVPIAGATAPAYTASAPGSYSCLVTAFNPGGATSRWSAGSARVTGPAIRVAVRKRRAMARPGRLATFRVEARNRGDLGARAAALCLNVPRKARAALKALHCRRLSLPSGARARVELRVRVKPTAAAGTHRLSITVNGRRAAKVTVRASG